MKMQTRSQTKLLLSTSLNKENMNPISNIQKKELEVNINFDEASEAWRSNKKSKGNGTYRYICLAKTKAGKECSREPIICSDFCKIHKNFWL